MSSCVSTSGSVSECKGGANNGVETGSAPIVEGANASDIGDACVSDREGMVPDMDSVGASTMENIGDGSVVGEGVFNALGGENMGDNLYSVDLVDNVFVEGEDVGGDDFGAVCEGAGTSDVNLDAVGGEVEVKNEKERESVEGEGGDGGSVGGDAEDAIGDGSGGGDGDSGATNVSNLRPVPLITRRRLREILAHAEGECIVLVCI